MDSFSFLPMRYFYKPKQTYNITHGEIYVCNHPVYNFCTLYKSDNIGLAVIQQRYDPITKRTWWGAIDPWLFDDFYNHEGFKEYFKDHAAEEINGLYPTVTIRQIMWAFRMKPLPKQRWETVFDRKDI